MSSALDRLADRCIRVVAPWLRERRKVINGWQAFGCIAWRSKLPRQGEVVPKPKLVREILTTPPSAPLTRVAETVSDEYYQDALVPAAIYETPDGRAVAIDMRLEPMLRGLRPMLVDSFPIGFNCAVAGVDARGRTQVLVMERLP